MCWKVDLEATRAAAAVFADTRPRVTRNDRQYVLRDSPFGRMELFELPGRRFLVAAAAPPPEARGFDRTRLAADLADHLSRHGLAPWKIVTADSAAEAIGHLLDDDPSADGGAPPLTWSPYLRPLDEPVDLIGPQRRRTARQVASLIEARGRKGPLPVLSGPGGVGKRAVTAAAAEALELSPVELPLHRVLAERVLQTPLECLLDTLLAAGAHMDDSQLLAVSDAQAIGYLGARIGRQVLVELERLDRIVLLCDSDPAPATPIPRTVVLPCAGLSGIDEAGDLLGSAFPTLTMAGSALAMVCRAAAVDGAGIVPQRFLYLVRLVLSWTDAAVSSAPMCLRPDDVQPAIELARGAWADNRPDHP